METPRFFIRHSKLGSRLRTMKVLLRNFASVPSECLMFMRGVEDLLRGMESQRLVTEDLLRGMESQRAVIEDLLRGMEAQRLVTEDLLRGMDAPRLVTEDLLRLMEALRLVIEDFGRWLEGLWVVAGLRGNGFSVALFRSRGG